MNHTGTAKHGSATAGDVLGNLNLEGVGKAGGAKKRPCSSGPKLTATTTASAQPNALAARCARRKRHAIGALLWTAHMGVGGARAPGAAGEGVPTPTLPQLQKELGNPTQHLPGRGW